MTSCARPCATSSGGSATPGIDFVNEGELTKGGNFVTFVNSRLSGFEASKATTWRAS